MFQKECRHSSVCPSGRSVDRLQSCNCGAGSDFVKRLIEVDGATMLTPGDHDSPTPQLRLLDSVP
jgi:hypothetical protein